MILALALRGAGQAERQGSPDLQPIEPIQRHGMALIEAGHEL